MASSSGWAWRVTRVGAAEVCPRCCNIAAAGRCLVARSELPLEMPVPGEPVERSADDLTGPGDDERVGRRVVGTRHRGGEARTGPAGLRRALVEVELVPRSGPRPGLPGELAVLEADAGGGDGLAGLRVGRIGGDAKGDGTERGRRHDVTGQSITGGAELRWFSWGPIPGQGLHCPRARWTERGPHCQV